MGVDVGAEKRNKYNSARSDYVFKTILIFLFLSALLSIFCFLVYKIDKSLSGGSEDSFVIASCYFFANFVAFIHGATIRDRQVSYMIEKNGRVVIREGMTRMAGAGESMYYVNAFIIVFFTLGGILASPGMIFAFILGKLKINEEVVFSLKFWIIMTILSMLYTFITGSFDRLMKRNMLFKKLFRKKGVKAVSGILDELSYSFTSEAFQMVRATIENESHSNVEKALSDGTTPRDLVNYLIREISYSMISSGEYHLTRGVINPLGYGKDLLNLFKYSVKELGKSGWLSKEETSEDLKYIEEIVRSSG